MDDDDVEHLAFGRSRAPAVVGAALVVAGLVGAGAWWVSGASVEPEVVLDGGVEIDGGGGEDEPTAVAEPSARKRRARAGKRRRRKGAPSSVAPSPRVAAASAAEEEPLEAPREKPQKLGAASVRRYIKQRSGVFYGCYKAKLKADRAAGIDKAAKGKIEVVFSVAPRGHVTSTKVARDTLGAPDVQRCVLDAFRPLRFEESHEGADDVLYTFVFEQT